MENDMSIFVAVQSDDFCVASEYDELRQQANCGAIVTFSGLVRELSNNILHNMTLEHYPSMTEQALIAIAEQAKQRWQLGAVLGGLGGHGVHPRWAGAARGDFTQREW
jgi:molybdopterin synthase catalytic subunit